jgi:hypothetical protein
MTLKKESASLNGIDLYYETEGADAHRADSGIARYISTAIN